VDLRAPHGTAGTLLLDPHNILVSTNNGTFPGTNSVSFGDYSTNNDVTISPVSLASQLDTNNVTLQANTDIIFSNNAVVAPTAGNNSLTLEAGRSILLSNAVD